MHNDAAHGHWENVADHKKVDLMLQGVRLFIRSLMYNLEYVSSIIGLIGGTLGIIAFFRDSLGHSKIKLSFEKGKDAYPNKNYIERHTNLVIQIVKTGRVKQSIASAKFETRNLDSRDGYLINLDDHIDISSFIGSALEQNSVKRLEYEFISQSNQGIEGLLRLIEMRVVITDNRNKTYVSPWTNYEHYTLSRSTFPSASLSRLGIVVADLCFTNLQ